MLQDQKGIQPQSLKFGNSLHDKPDRATLKLLPACVQD